MFYKHSYQSEDPETVDETHSFNKRTTREEEDVEGPSQVSAANKVVIYRPAEEEKEGNVNDTETEEVVHPESVPRIKPDEISEAINNVSLPSEDKEAEQPDRVSTAEEIINYQLAEEEEREANDTTTADEVQPTVDPGVKANDISETTHYASESTKSEDPETVDATQCFNKRTTREDKVVEGPSQVSAANEVVNYSPAEEEKEGNVNDTEIEERVHPEFVPSIKPDEISEAINNFKEPEPIHAIQSANRQLPREDKVVEQPDQVSTAEEIINYHLAEEEEREVKETTTADEVQPKADPGATANDISETTHYASESTKSEDPETVDATQSFNKRTTREDKVVEGPSQVSAANEVVNYSPAEEEKEGNVNDTEIEERVHAEFVPSIKPDEISEAINNFKEPEPIHAIQSANRQLPREDKVVEQPDQVSTAEEIINYHLAEEEEREVKETTTADEVQPKADPGATANDISETTHYASESTKSEDPETVDATQSFNKRTTREDKVVEQPDQVSTVEEIIHYQLAEEEERYVNDTTTVDEVQPKVDPGVRANDVSETTHYASESTKSFNKRTTREDKVVEGPSQFSAANELVNYSPAEEEKEGNVNDTGTEEDVHPEFVPRIKPDEISEAINNGSFQEPGPIDDIQSVNKQLPSEDKVVEQPDRVSTAEEIINYQLAEKEEREVNDTTTADEVQPTVDPGVKANDIAETTHYASESTKSEDPETVDATQSFNERTTREDKVVEGPSQVSAANEVVNYSPAEEEKEGNVNDKTVSYELNPRVDQGEKVNEVSETIVNASESTKSFNKDIQREDKVVEGPPRVSTEEEIVTYSPAEEGNAKCNVKEKITRDELKPEVYPKVQLEVPVILEATQGINTLMPSEDEVVEGTTQVSTAEDVGNYRLAEEINEERNVEDTTEDKLPTRIKLEESNGTDVAHSFEKEIPRKGEVVEEPCQVSAAEEPVNDNPAQGEERNVIDAAKYELKPQMVPGVKLDEISENMKNARESTKFQEPEPIDATQSANKQIQSEDKVVEGPYQALTAEEIANYHLADEGDVKNIKETTTVAEHHELEPKVVPGARADEISEIHYASESTKFKEPNAVDATCSFEDQVPKQDKVVEGPAKVSSGEQIVNYSPAEEEKEERNVKDTTISNELKPDVDLGELSSATGNASQITKFEEPEIIDVTPSFNKEIASEDKIVEGPPQVSAVEGIVSFSPEEEQKAEKDVKETTTGDELKTHADPKLEEDEASETTNSTSNTAEFYQFELPENVEATKEVNTQMPTQDKIAKGSIQVAIAKNIGTFSLTEERKDKNVDDVTGDESPTRIKLEGSSVTDATQSFEKVIPSKDKVVEQPFQEELVNDSPAEEGKEERNVADAATQDELQLEVATGIELDEISETKKNASEITKFQEPEPINKQITSEDKVIEGPYHVSTAEEIVNYHLEDKGEEKNVKDTTTDELKLKVESGAQADEKSETHHASESTKLKEAETVDATRSFQKQILTEDEVVEGPPKVSTAEDIFSYSSTEEEKQERNVKDTTIIDDLKSEVHPVVKVHEIPETISNASEIIKFKEPDSIDVTQSSNKDIPIERELDEGPYQVSTAEEIVNNSQAEEGKAERNLNETANTDEQNTEVNPNTEFEVPGTVEATQGINTLMPSEDEVVGEHFQVSIAEDLGNYNQEKERKEDGNAKNTTVDKLPAGIKLEETDGTDVTQCFKKQIPSTDQVEGPCLVSTVKEPVNFRIEIEGTEEKSVMGASTQDEIKPEVAPEINPDETSETLKNASESTEFQEPEMIDSTHSSNKRMTYDDRDVEGPHQVSTAERTDNYILAQGEEWNVKNTRILGELKPGVNPGAQADAISETTYCTSGSTKFEEPDTVDANQTFKKQKSRENNVVEEFSQDSTTEEMVDYKPAEERKEEWNIKDTKIGDDSKPEVDPGVNVNNKSNIINNASQSTKLEDDETMHVTQNSNKQITSEEEVAEGPPQVTTAEEIQIHSPAGEGKEEKGVKDTSFGDDLKTGVYPIVKVDQISETTNNATETTKFQEPDTIGATQSSKKQIPSEDTVVGGSCEVSTANETTNYSLDEEGEETNVKDTTEADDLKTEEDTRGKVDEISVSTTKVSESTKQSDETETIDATQSFAKGMPSEAKVVEGPHQGPTTVAIVNNSPEKEEKEEMNAKDTKSKMELQEQADKFPRSNTETEVTTSNEKVEVPEEGVKGSNDQEKIFENDSEVTARESSENFGECIVCEAEPLKPIHEKIEDYPKTGYVAKEDTNNLESQQDDEQTEYSASQSLYEITNATGGLDLEKKEGSVDEAVTVHLSGTSGDEESNKLNKEQYPLITEREPRKEVSSTGQGSSFKDEEMEEKVEEQENLSTRTSVTKPEEDEILSKKSENDDTIFHNQNQNSDFRFIGQESAREIHGEIKELHSGNHFDVAASDLQGESEEERKTRDESEDTSNTIKPDLIPEVKVRERPKGEILTEAEGREDKDMVDTSMKEIAQESELADLTQATNNSEDINVPCKSSIAMSDLEIIAKEDPEVGSESKFLSEDREISLVQKGPRGETLQPVTEELKSGDAFKAVGEAVREEYGEKEQLNDDCKEQTENFRTTISAESSPSEMEQSKQETAQEQEDGEAQDQQKNIHDSTLEMTRKEGPSDAASEVDANIPLGIQKLEVAPCFESDKHVEEADPNDSSIDTKGLPEVQQKEIAESFSAGGEEPVEYNEDKENEETKKSILEEKSTTSLPELLSVSRNEISQASGNFKSESKQTIQKEETKDGKAGTSEPEEPNTNKDKDEDGEGEGDKQKNADSGYDHPVIVEASRDVDVKVSPKKSHNILSSVGSKVKHSIAKVKKVITGKSSHPKPSSAK
ncbi:hypothetical protein ACH5RR_014461 [Cinchona calisaya]|uniref:Titin n=1 Tax=Cinchona calisaya TaxID=153742 RepID=A0ABD3A311_9GENT